MEARKPDHPPRKTLSPTTFANRHGASLATLGWVECLSSSRALEKSVGWYQAKIDGNYEVVHPNNLTDSVAMLYV
jgi:hypothetical protein